MPTGRWDDDEDGRREIWRKPACQKAQDIETAGGSSNCQDVVTGHVCVRPGTFPN
jgi:hypothetical protein